jgi:hypothetical protein
MFSLNLDAIFLRQDMSLTFVWYSTSTQHLYDSSKCNPGRQYSPTISHHFTPVTRSPSRQSLRHCAASSSIQQIYANRSYSTESPRLIVCSQHHPYIPTLDERISKYYATQFSGCILTHLATPPAIFPSTHIKLPSGQYPRAINP